MKIIKFLAKSVHGYLDFDIEFNDRLNFLTGINGTGKTTALNSIVSLLIPDPQFLCNVRYDLVKVTIELDGENLTIQAKSNDIGALLSLQGSRKSVQLNTYLRDPDVPLYRQEEYEAEYYRDQIASLRSDEVIRKIIDLPSPMYLGLDRRVIHGAGKQYRRAPSHRNPRLDSKRTVFSGNMENRLMEALDLAEHSHSQQSLKQNTLDAEFQRQLLLELINLSPVTFRGDLKLPGKEETTQVAQWLQTLATLPNVLRLEKRDVDLAIRPMSEFLKGLGADIAKLPSGEMTGKELNDDATHQVMLRWAFNRPYIEKIERVTEIIHKYSEKRVEIEELNNRYLHGINKFFADGGKKVDFDARGKISFSSMKSEKPIGFSSLSSGEIQLFVILTHLYFNPDAQAANLFIIDEPELSLHVNWQEAFVDGLLDATTEEVQLVLATHAPSIILHRTGNCIEIEQKS